MAKAPVPRTKKRKSSDRTPTERPLEPPAIPRLLLGNLEQKFKNAEIKRQTSSRKAREKQLQNESAKYRSLYQRRGEEAIGEYLFLHPEGLSEPWVQNTLINLLEKRSMLDAFLSSNPKLWAKNSSAVEKKSHAEIGKINQRLRISLGMQEKKRTPQSREYLISLIKRRIDEVIKREKVSVDKALDRIIKTIPKGFPLSLEKLQKLYSQAKKEGK